jgi:hypothetical protein
MGFLSTLILLGIFYFSISMLLWNLDVEIPVFVFLPTDGAKLLLQFLVW